MDGDPLHAGSSIVLPTTVQPAIWSTSTPAEDVTRPSQMRDGRMDRGDEERRNAVCAVGYADR